MRKKKIVFATIEAGGGHKMPALAIYEALNILFPDRYEVRIMDFMKDLGATRVDNIHKQTWKYMLSRPLLTKSIQTMASVTGPMFREGFKSFLAPFYGVLRRFLEEEQLDLIFSTHYFNTLAVSRVRAKSDLKLILINYLTEIFDINTYWFLKDVDYYLVASEEARSKLRKMRYPSDKLRVFPYPVRKSFFTIERSREEIARSLDLDPDRKTMLVTLGQEGIGSLDRLFSALMEQEYPLNVLVVTGYNQELKRELEENYTGRSRKTTIRSLGFVENINELIHLADFCFIKPGPATTWEVISLKKPIIFYRSAQLSEIGNIRFALDRGIGFYVGRSARRFIQVLDRLIYGEAIGECRDNYAGLDIPNGSDLIARFLDEVLSSIR